MSSEERYTQDQIKQGWKRFLAGEDPSGLVRDEILRAWIRCRAQGCNPRKVSVPPLTDKKEIQRRLNLNAELLDVSIPAIHHLYQFIKADNLFVSVSDADGYLLTVYGDTSAIDPSNDILYTNWNENNLGNNPIGTSLTEDHPVQTFGYEHYCMFPHRFSGSGVAIHNPKGAILGAISMTHITAHPQHYTLAMMLMTAYAIEKQLKLHEYHKTMQISYQKNDAIVNSISTGVLTLDENSVITSTNNALVAMLHTPKERLIGKPFCMFCHENMLERAIVEKSAFTDYVTKLRVESSTYPCTITSRPIMHQGVSETLMFIDELSRIHKLAKTQTSHTFDTIVGVSNQFRHTVEVAQQIAPNDSNVLLLGESGTGKDVFAQAIHNQSPRRNGPFIPINCAAIQKDLIMSELFGYEEGSFTGAKKGGNIGKFECADGGTLFLDEIGEMPLELQPTLLRAVEHRMIIRVGGKSFIPVNVRIIAATNSNLHDSMLAGKFRQDLYYRLNIFSIHLLPLRERKEDIPSLVTHFLSKLSFKYGKVVSAVTDETMALLLDYDWPGNIRELQNCIERCVALTNASVITPELLLPWILDHSSRPMTPAQPGPVGPGRATGNNEGETLRALLARHHWNITAVAKSMGITRATVYRKIKLHQLEK